MLLFHVNHFLSNQDKRKASTDNLIQQPLLKKMAADSTISAMPRNSMPVEKQGAASGFPTVVGASSVSVSAISRQASDENVPRREIGGRGLNTSTVLAQAWKEDMDAGHLLASLFELFSESMFSFTPKPELSFFL